MDGPHRNATSFHRKALREFSWPFLERRRSSLWIDAFALGLRSCCRSYRKTEAARISGIESKPPALPLDASRWLHCTVRGTVSGGACHYGCFLSLGRLPSYTSNPFGILRDYTPGTKYLACL